MSWIVIVLPDRSTPNADVSFTIHTATRCARACVCACACACVGLRAFECIACVYETSSEACLHSRSNGLVSGGIQIRTEGVTVRLLVTITTYEFIHVSLLAVLTPATTCLCSSTITILTPQTKPSLLYVFSRVLAFRSEQDIVSQTEQHVQHVRITK